MIVPCRLFRLEKVIPLKELQRKLKEKRIIDKFKVKMNEEDLELLTIIDDLVMKEKDLHGSIIYEVSRAILQTDGGVNYVKEAVKVKFVFTLGSSLFFILLASRWDAENAATKMNKAFFKADIILKQPFSTKMIEMFLRQNSHVLRHCNWSDLNIPGISKAALGGTNLSRSPDHKRYDDHGHKSSVMVTLRENGLTVRLSQTGGIAFISAMSEEEILQFVKNKILPLV